MLLYMVFRADSKKNGNSVQSFAWLPDYKDRNIVYAMEMVRLIERCRQGDADALGQLYQTYAPRMRRVCRRYVSDEPTVEDVLHDAFVIILTSFDHLRDNQKAEAWMVAITRNVASKYKDHLNALRTVPLEDAHAVPMPEDAAAVRGVPLDEVMQLVDRLPEGYANVFRLSVFEGMTHKEIAAMLGIEPHSSSSQLTRAKKMLRKSLAHYWWLWLLPLLLSVALYLLTDHQSPEEQKPVAARHGQRPAMPKPLAPEDTRPPHELTSRMAALPASRPVAAPAVHADTLLPAALFDRSLTTDIRLANLPQSLPLPVPHTAAATKGKRPWSAVLAYAGLPSTGISVVDNFLTVVDYASDGQTRSKRIYNWGEYMDYVNSYASEMDSIEASHMSQIAISNAGRPSDPITERKHHERPRIFEISFNYHFNKQWSLTTGLSYTQLNSTFESDGNTMLTQRTQRLHYAGLPLKLTYTLLERRRWQLYVSGGLQVEVPVRGSETTHYLYAGPYYEAGQADSLIQPTAHRAVQAPWQWSVHAGAGVQYQLLPHVNAYFEPRLQYYIPTGSPVETYRTEHPLDLSLPFGIRFTW